MKTLKAISVIGLMTLLTACGVTKTSTTTKANETEVVNRGRANTEIAVNGDNARTTQSSTENIKTASEVATVEAATKARMQKMYIDIEMSEDQINKFESEWNSSISKWRRSSPNKTMNTYERTEYQDSILNNILNDTQFEKYRVWARKNASASSSRN